MASSEIKITLRTELSPVLKNGIEDVIVIAVKTHRRESAEACSCGFSEWGQSFAQHLAQVILDQF